MFKEITLWGTTLNLFSVFVGIGLVSSVLALMLRVSRLRGNAELETKIYSAFPFCVLSGALGAHVFDVYAHCGFAAVFSECFFEYGIAVLGGFAGIILYLFVHARLVGISALNMLNFYVPLFALGQGFGRIGCFWGGCCFGRPCSIGVSYPEGSLPFSVYGNAPLFPVQLAESAWLFFVFFAAFRFCRFKYSASLTLVLISIGRFGFEFLRGDNRGEIVSFASPSQVLAFLIMIFGISLSVYARFNPDFGIPKLFRLSSTKKNI